MEITRVDHIGVAVKSIEEALKELKKKGVRLIDKRREKEMEAQKLPLYTRKRPMV